jgi:hypothetical protein
VNTEGWMMSYADMATILLAMFIVLSTLGKDQTGASLQKGLESWHDSRQTFGLSGLFPTSRLANKLGQVGPHYNLESDSAQINGQGSKESDTPGDRGIDQEEAQFQHFLKELKRQFDIESLPRVVGQATVDFFDQPNKTAPHWTARHQELLSQLLPLLRRGDSRVMIIVWAPMAKDSAMVRAAEKAKQLADELAGMARLEGRARNRLIAVAQTWSYVEFERPAVSLVISKTAPAGSGS